MPEKVKSAKKAKSQPKKKAGKKATKPKKLYSFKKSLALFQKATTMIPQGIYGHQSPALMIPGAYPYYAQEGKGVRYKDIDGNEFIDYLCAYGPMVVGYANKEVNKAAMDLLSGGDCLNHPQ